MRVAKTLNFNNLIQECIPVGCVLPAAVAVCWGGGVSASVHVGIPPGVGLETPLVWAWRPPCVGLEGVAWRPSGCGPGDPPDHTPQPPSLGCGPRDPPGQTPQLPPWVWAWRPARHAGIPPLETCKACWDTTCSVCWDTTTPPREQNDRQLQKFYLAPNFVCGR